MLDLILTSILPNSYRNDLESLMFFHPHQQFLSSSIVESIDSYGIPKINVTDGNIGIHIDNLQGVQSLFALAAGDDRPELLGVMIFTRISTDTVILLHMVVRDDYSSIGPHKEAMVGLQMVEALRKLAASLRGVQWIRILYGKGSTLSVRR